MAKGRREKLRQEADTSRELAQRLEVRSIKRYAIIRAYILKAMKLLGSLALLWSTVVLLGGFVTLLKGIDFWLLTFIGFIQAAGLFNMFVDDVKSFLKMIYMLARWRPRCEKSNFGARLLFLFKIALFVICFAPAVAVLVLAAEGPIVCFGLSLGRLLKRDYGSDNGDFSKANLTPALNIFYTLSAAQGALFLLCICMEIQFEGHMVWDVSRKLGFSYEVVAGFFDDTKLECAKNPSSTESWNLYTHATGLLDSELPADYLSGARVLNMLIGRKMPLKRLLIRSPIHRIEKLIRVLNWTSPAERETRGLAARIVAHLADDLDLSQFPGALECIVPLLDAVGHNRCDQEALHFPSRVKHQKPIGGLELLPQLLVIQILNLPQKNVRMQDTKKQAAEGKPTSGIGTHSDLLFQGLRILENLAHGEYNCSQIYSTKGMLSKITGPVSSDKLISDRKIDATWIKVLDASLRVVGRLMEAPGDTGTNMRHQIAGNRKALENLEAILGLKHDSSILELQTKAIDILAHMFSDESTDTSEDRMNSFIDRALHIFISDEWMEDYFKDTKKKIDEEITNQPLKDDEGPSPWEAIFLLEKYNGRRSTALQEKMMNEAQETARKHKEMAGKSLSLLSNRNQSNSKVINECRKVIACLTEMLGSRTETIRCSISATEFSILEIKTKTEWRISSAEILKNLCAHTKVDNDDKRSLLKKVLEEMLNGKTEQGTGVRSSSNTTATINDEEYLTPQEQRMLQAALLSLYAEIRTTWTDAGDFARILHDFAGEGFVGKLKSVVEDNSYATPACLSILKIACDMVKLFIESNHYLHEIKEVEIIDTLSEASKVMSGLESCLLFTGVVNDCHGVPVLPLSSVLVEQVREVLANAPGSANAMPAGGPEPQN